MATAIARSGAAAAGSSMADASDGNGGEEEKGPHNFVRTEQLQCTCTCTAIIIKCIIIVADRRDAGSMQIACSRRRRSSGTSSVSELCKL